MTIELFCLSLFALVIVANILIQQLTSMFDFGLKPILGSREDVKFVGITGRLERAILNSIIAITLTASASATSVGDLGLSIKLAKYFLPQSNKAFSATFLATIH